MKTSEVLERARTEVARGWTKGEYVNEGGNVCALGAVHRACGHRFDQHGYPVTESDGPLSECSIACAALRAHLGEFGDFVFIEDFNDDEGIVQQDVLNLFDKAIGTLQERGE